MISFSNITKRFPGVLALDGVSFEIETGSCHALIGENGAGKSTLGKILAGVYTADSGEIRVDGELVHAADPLAARKLGIAMVHQELAFCPNLSVAENLCLGELPRSKIGWVDRADMHRRAGAMLREIGATMSPDVLIETLSTGQEQLVQIAGAVGTGAKIIVMDEPTSSLSAGETRELFRLVRELKQRGITLIYVSHRMEELFELCDHITVLRDGRHVSTEPIRATNAQRVVTQMIGRELKPHTPAHLLRELGPERLRVKKLCSSRFEDIHLSVHAGEIVGIAGLVGAGRSEVVQAIFGLDPDAHGEIVVNDRAISCGSVQAALAARLGLVPEDRKRQGLVLGLSCRENTSLASLPLLSRIGWVNRAKERALAGKYNQRLRVKTPSMETLIAGLSGGNQQKVALAKWLARQCDVLLIDEPTRGVDVGAKSEIYQLLDELACEGKAILVVSSELPELIGLCRRILVMRNGRIAGELPKELFSENALMQLMAGLGNTAPAWPSS
ncbi:MAG TPA: sugar ABC transporter ATP-binding protein [Opitutaceae bacterium]|nr:sugar ABC transporter ATP-binding protein [Opitutaceae bacterium]